MSVLAGAGLRLRGVPEFVTPDRSVGLPAVMGGLHAGLVSYAWGLLAAWLALRLPGWRGAAAVGGLALGIHLVDPRLPTIARIAAGAPSAGQRALCVLLLAVGAATGSWLASRPERVPA